jgi:hypothetical protein
MKYVTGKIKLYFKNFCDFFKLRNSFVDDNYGVITLKGNLFPDRKPRDTYRNNNIDAIIKRNSEIFR